MVSTATAMNRLAIETAVYLLTRVTQLEAQGRSIMNLGVGQPDFETQPHIVEAAVKALRDGHHGYTPTNGIAPLREAVTADLEARYDMAVHPDRVVIVPGAKVTMFFAILMFGEPGVEILCPDPGYPIFRSLIDYCGAKAVPIRLAEDDCFAFSAEAVLARITPATRLIILNSPANPTGGVAPRSEMDRLVTGLEAHPNVAILADEIYSQILYDNHAHTSLLQYPSIADRAIVLDGWSKTYAMTGWRLGYGIWPDSLVEAAIRLAGNCYSCVNTAAQYAGIAALTGPQDSVHQMVSTFDERRRVMVEELNSVSGIRCLAPGGAFYTFPNISETGMTAKALETGLLEDAGVATIAGTSFGREGEGYLRLSYANSIENIREAVYRIGHWLSERQVA